MRGLVSALNFLIALTVAALSVVVASDEGTPLTIRPPARHW